MLKFLIKIMCLGLITTLCSSCAVLYHVQVGDVDARDDMALIPFEVMVSETGVDLQQAQDIARATNSSAGNDAAGVLGLIALFQIGDRTGKPVYNEKYAEKLVYLIHEKCPSGRVTGLTSIREMREYPVISGEIVKVTGFCMRPRTKS